MPEQPLPITSFADRDACCAGWSETGFLKSFRKRRLSPAQEIDDACERDAHDAAPGTKLRSGCLPGRAPDNMLVENWNKMLIAPLCHVNEIFFNKAGDLPARPSRLIQKENLRNR